MALEILLPLTSLHYYTYEVIGFTWRWNVFDQLLIAFSFMTAVPRMWRDGRALHHACRDFSTRNGRNLARVSER